MRYSPDTRSFTASATDLANHARCEHLTDRARELSVAIAEGRAEPTIKSSLVIDKGREFEASYVAARRAEVEAAGGRFLDASAAGEEPGARRAAVEAAMRDGVELIAQAPMRSATLFGYADLLERVSDSSTPGGTLDTVHRYEPVEIKYGRTPRPEYLLQASAYADALELLQGDMPGELHVVTGDGTRHDFATADYVEYFRAARERFTAALEVDLDVALEAVPDPVAHCVGCDFEQTCLDRWRDLDHLSQVAGIRADQRVKLTNVGLDTMTLLAGSQVDHVAGIGRATLPRLVTQARLQHESRDVDPAKASIAYRRPGEDEPGGRGFALLPEPDPDDMFFDFEGYPYHERGALEYLWGWTTQRTDGTLAFDHLWADDPAAEAQAFTRFLDEVHARRARSGGRMHVFHYAPYEITALRRLAKEHHAETERLDQLLRDGVFVDLYAVVRQSMQVGRPSYSIKALEPLYGVSREGDELADGGASIEVYERWLTDRDEVVRDTIIDYNRVDCDSSLALRDWLLEHRDLARTSEGIEWPTAAVTEEEPSRRLDEDAHEIAALVSRLQFVADDPSHADDVRLAARLLSGMPGWGRRISREFYGDLHGRKHDRHPEDDVSDPNVLSDLRLLEVDGSPARAGAGTIDRTYAFPDQVFVADVGQHAIDPSTVQTVGSIRELDPDANTVTIRTTAGQRERLRATGHDTRLPRAVIGFTDIGTGDLERVAARLGTQLLACVAAGRDPFVPSEPGAAALSVLARHHTRTTSGGGPALVGDPPEMELLADLVQRIDGSHVIVQGPPGTGKTYTSARLVSQLVDAGLRVGISSNSHDAIINVLRGIDRYRDDCHAAGMPCALRAAYPLRTTIGEKMPGTFGFGDAWIERTRSSTAAAKLLSDGEVQVVAGTAWALAKCEELDVVLVDEAGQVSLLHLTAMAARARRVVLVGDPQQLPQPAEVQHPHGCGASALEHLFGDEPVLPHDRAVLLPVTYRMHPDVCGFISDTYYRGELRPHASTSIQRVDAPAARVPGHGIHLLAVHHVGNRSSSREEVDAIRDLVAHLLDGGRGVPAPDTPEREIRLEDIIVVAPYNAQRRALRTALGEDIRIGTVDKFQGQEAPIAIVSMTASSRDDLPRGLEFLLDPHRLNVAISRARALCVLVASPALLATSAATLHEMRLLNDLARFARVSGQAAASRSSTWSSRS